MGSLTIGWNTNDEIHAINMMTRKRFCKRNYTDDQIVEKLRAWLKHENIRQWPSSVDTLTCRRHVKKLLAQF